MSLVSVFSYYRVSKSLMVFFELLRYIIKNIINHLSPPKNPLVYCLVQSILCLLIFFSGYFICSSFSLFIYLYIGYSLL